MAFELPNGKTARNIQEQVAFITEKVKELFAAVSELGFKVLTVEELPQEGAARTIYLVPSSDPETENIYDEYIWTEDGWEKIGSTDIDLTNYMTLDTEQTITAIKNLAADLIPLNDRGAKLGSPEKRFSDINASKVSNLYSSLQLAAYGDIQFVFSGTNRAILSNRNGQDDLGTSESTFRDLYLSGELKEGTNSATVADMAALITYAKAQGWIQ